MRDFFINYFSRQLSGVKSALAAAGSRVRMSLKIGLGQFDAIVGGLEANVRSMEEMYARAKAQDVDLLVFPELAISGYPPEDLLLKKHFFADNYIALEKLAISCKDIPMLVGFAQQHKCKQYNAMAFLHGGAIKKTYQKCLLPNYGVFDEQRYFSEGSQPAIIEVKGMRIAMTICEDLWFTDWVANFLASSGQIDLIVNISASPFHVGKIITRQKVLASCASKLRTAVAYCNLVGGQDELVFDGRSMLVDSKGEVRLQAKAFEEDLLVGRVERQGADVNIVDSEPASMLGDIEEVFGALVLGTRDYVRKNGFKRVVIGISGGIDSALTAAIAVEALGADNVVGVTMPSKFNSAETISDSGLVGERLGIEFHTIPIGTVLESFDKALGAVEGWSSAGLAYENLQARIRGSMLMSLSNQMGWLVLTTGNKSETAVGYSTLYGDTAGGFAVIKDVPKTLVYRLAAYFNQMRGAEVIPQSIIDRIPTAELRPNQKDTDSLPQYDILDTILRSYVEEDQSISWLIDSGMPAEAVTRVVRMIDKNEYKRRQSPPGIKITPKAFGKDWRLPITNAYKG